VLRSDFEEILILQTPYYEKLRKTYRDVLNFGRYLEVFKKITPEQTFVTILEKRGGKELVYLGRKIFTLQQEFIETYIQFIKDESQINKWETFFERYSNNLFEIYSKFVKGATERVLIFEIVNRKLLREMVSKMIHHEPVDIKIQICERFSVVVNQLFNYVRNSLTKNIAINDSLIVNTYEKVPLIPKYSQPELMKMLTRSIQRIGLAEPFFSELVKNTLTVYYTGTKQEVLKQIREAQYFSKESIQELFKSHFFFPDDDTVKEIIEVFRERSEQILGTIKNRGQDLQKKINELVNKGDAKIKESEKEIKTMMRDFSTEEQLDAVMKKLKHGIVSECYDLRRLKSEYDELLKKETDLVSIANVKSADLKKFITKNNWDPLLILIMNKEPSINEEILQDTLRVVLPTIKNDKVANEIMNQYRTTAFLKEKFDLDSISQAYRMTLEEVLLPLLTCFVMEELIEYYPKLSGIASAEEVRYLAEEAVGNNVPVIEKDIKSVVVKEKMNPLVIDQYRKLVSVLVYDIRGSTFMGTKLRDAKIESEIRNYFQEAMLAVVMKYGGVPIKDTGDGGIVLFAANNPDLTEHSTTELEAGEVMPAVRCGMQMVQAAQSFVQDNIKKYKEWFREAEERSIDFEGATFATLPPSYQSIFQIGVGIASGAYPREVYLDRNAYDEYDLTGMLVREANFYSKVKARSKSTVICDDASVYNMLLNVNKFSFISDRGLRIDPMLIDLEQGLEYWINQKYTRRGFMLDLHKIFVTQMGQEITHPGNIKIMLGFMDIAIEETGEIKDGKGGRGKFLFELSSEAIK
jgi:class 3 adenylate cyclase